MKHLIAGAFVLLAAPAMAADMAVKAAPVPMAVPYSWSGLYVGLNAGGGWANECWSLKGAFIVGFDPPLSEGCHDATGAVVGGQIGYRYQVNSLVFGIEAAGDWANLRGSNRSAIFDGINAAISPNAINLVNSTRVNAIGMFTGQVGYTITPALLLYAKGGAAITDNTYSGSLSVTGPNIPAGFPNPLLTDTGKEIKFGGVVGAGLEWMFMPGWSVGAEYNHLFMGSRDVGLHLTNAPFAAGGGVNLLGAGSPSRHESISQDIDMVTVRLNYAFGPR